MNLFWASVFLVAGLAILWKAADLLVDSAVAVAKRLDISAFVIGLTIIAMGTSAPEVAAGIAAALRGAGDIAIGNVYGSNIANFALVGGLCACIRPVKTLKHALWWQLLTLLAVTLLIWPALSNLKLSQMEGLGLLIAFVVFLMVTIYYARRQNSGSNEKLSSVKPVAKNDERDTQARAQQGRRDAIRSTKRCFLFIIIGLVGLAAGADITVRGAVYIGRTVGLSDAVIGLTIIAAGTSLPELVTSLVAVLKGQDEVSIGNLVGSNIFNTLLVVGIAGSISPFTISARLIGFDYWILVGVSVAFAAAAFLGRGKIGRCAGLLLFCAYIAYIIYLLAFNR